jgi:hypothetical protein
VNSYWASWDDDNRPTTAEKWAVITAMVGALKRVVDQPTSDDKENDK